MIRVKLCDGDAVRVLERSVAAACAVGDEQRMCGQAIWVRLQDGVAEFGGDVPHAAVPQQRCEHDERIGAGWLRLKDAAHACECAVGQPGGELAAGEGDAAEHGVWFGQCIRDERIAHFCVVGFVVKGLACDIGCFQHMAAGMQGPRAVAERFAGIRRYVEHALPGCCCVIESSC